MNRKLTAVAVAALMVLSVTAPALAADEDLAVSVTQAGNDADVTISVTENGSAAPNATVDVAVREVLEDEDDNETTNVTIGGTYETGPDGTVQLGAPSADVRVDVTATLANRTASTTTVLESADGNESEDAFGQQVQAFVQQLLDGDRNGTGIGGAVSEFVTANNPGADNRPDHAGPPEDIGPGDNETDKRGPPDHAGPDGNETDDDDRRGPPDHAGPSDDDEGDDTDEQEDELEDEETEDEQEDEAEDGDSDDTGDNGPPDHAGPPN